MSTEKLRTVITEDMLNAPNNPTGEQKEALERLQLGRNNLEDIKSQEPDEKGRVEFPGSEGIKVDQEVAVEGLRRDIAGSRIQAGITNRTVQEQLDDEKLKRRIAVKSAPEESFSIEVNRR